VRVVETGQTVVTDDSGCFVLAHLPGGPVTLAVRAVGFQEGTPTQVQVPRPDGVYDLTLTPL
jgi:hypothetical protein